MDNQRKMMIGMLIIGLPLFIWIQFFEIPSKVKIGEEKMQQDPETHAFENVVQYESIYMDDASNTRNLVNDLPLSDYVKNIQLDEENLTLFIDYDLDVLKNEKTVQQSVIYNATATFALIENVKEIEMKFKDKTYTVSRDRVEKWFGMTLIDFKDPAVFQEKVQDQLLEDISEWFLTYIESE